MKTSNILLVLSFVALVSSGWSQTKKLDTNLIQSATGLTGKMNAEEGVFKVTAPRTDVKVTVDQSPMPPFMGLTSWASFKAGMKEEAMVMGDLVLFQDEVTPAMSAALENGLNVTALHNHFFYDEPKVYFMHIEGEGEQKALGSAVKAALDAMKKVRDNQSHPATAFGPPLPARSSISADALQKILTAKPDVKD